MTRLGTSEGRIRARLQAIRERTTVIELTETSSEDLRVEWRLELDDLLPASSEPATAPGEAVAALERTWPEVRQTVERVMEEQGRDMELDEPCFRLCSDAWQDLVRNDFAYPAWMEDALMRLARLARKYAEAHGSVGDFPAWAQREEGLELVMKDAGLSVHNRNLITCKFDGAEYMAELHVKLQKSAKWVPPKENGRIYFALDSKRWRFIIHHIGLKLG